MSTIYFVFVEHYNTTIETKSESVIIIVDYNMIFDIMSKIYFLSAVHHNLTFLVRYTQLSLNSYFQPNF